MKSRMLLLRLLVLVAAGCSAADADSPSVAQRAPDDRETSTHTDAQRAIAEADIIQLDAERLYALSKSGTVSVVDVSTPGVLTLLGQETLSGEPFEMYRREGLLLAMSNGALGSDGELVGGARTDRSTGAAVFVLDVQDPARIRTLARLPVPGEIADSRIVGDVLYLATYENSRCYQCGPSPRTLVTSFDISEPTQLRQVEQVSFESSAPDGSNLAWGTSWKRSIFVTEQRLYIGGHADLDTQNLGTTSEGIIDVLDVSDAGGRLRTGARIRVAGPILSRWQLDERDGILRVVSQKGAGRTGNGIGAPEVDTFRIENARTFTPLGHMRMNLPRQEGLRTVRFDGSRAYAITYNQTDPLFVIDLSDPSHPEQRGELHIPGFMFHLEPHGDRVIGLGIDRTDPQGSLNVSLFDVSDPDEPLMLERVAFATPLITEDYQILNDEVPEDQDRIQKSFRVFPGGLVVVPFSAPRAYGAQGSSCDNLGGGVQLLQWSGDSLHERALLPLPGNPRRAFEHDQQLIAVSESNVRAFSLSDLDVAHQTADLTIGTCTESNTTYPLDNDFAGDGHNQDGYLFACSVGAARGGGSSGWRVLLGLLALALPRLKRRQR
jgi:Beta propeller domain